MSEKNIRLVSITQEQFNEAIHLLMDRIARGNQKYGPFPFVSPKESYGKLEEEMHECKMELHAKHDDRYYDELLDLATVCIWAIAGRSNVFK